MKYPVPRFFLCIFQNFLCIIEGHFYPASSWKSEFSFFLVVKQPYIHRLSWVMQIQKNYKKSFSLQPTVQCMSLFLLFRWLRKKTTTRRRKIFVIQIAVVVSDECIIYDTHSYCIIYYKLSENSDRQFL